LTTQAFPPTSPPLTSGPPPTRAEPHRLAGLLRRTFAGRPGDPRWARPALWAVLALAAILYTWNLSANGNANSYYSAAVLSATKSWKAFFFGSLDAGSFITVDKPPMALWLMALSGRIFGFHPWSLLLPQAAAGVAAVGVLYTAVRRTFRGYGQQHPAEHAAAAAATIAALVLALTPITVAINRDNNPDTLLVLLLVLAAWACLTAIGTGRLLPLLGSAVAIGCAFNTKMLQAYLVLPGFALVYLLIARGGLLARLRRLLIAGAVLVVSSFWWMLLVDWIPAGSRPYIGGSTDGTVWDLVIGYNGLGRVFGGEGGPGGGGGGRGGRSFGGVAGAGRLFNDIIGGQISWLLPFATIALVAGVALRGRAQRTDIGRAALLLWGGWLAVHLVVFSFAKGTFHPYYTTALAPAIGALAGTGGVMMFQAGRRSAGWGWALPLALAVTGAWSFTLLRRSPGWNPWLAWTVAAVTVPAVAALIVARLTPRAGARLAISGAIIGLAGALAGPAAYAVDAASSRVNGTNPLAGPASGAMGFPGGGRMRPPGAGGGLPRGSFPGGAPRGNLPGGASPGGAFQGGGQAAPGGGGGMGGRGGRGGPDEVVDSKLISFLRQNQGGATWLVAVSSAQSASSIILQTGRPVIAMGGFTGTDPALTVTKQQKYVAEGKLRYVMTGDRMGPGGGGDSTVTSWVRQNCTVVPTAQYGGTSTSSASSSAAESGGQQLYRCG
jgi:4-amino-4-deoxy-L-arabinose transferase-like glycosyltransferase